MGGMQHPGPMASPMAAPMQPPMQAMGHMQVNPAMQPPAMHPGAPQPQEPKVKVIEVMEPSAPPCQLGPMIEFEDDEPGEIVYENPSQSDQPMQYEPKMMYEGRREDPRQ